MAEHEKCATGTHWNETSKKCQKLPDGLRRASGLAKSSTHVARKGKEPHQHSNAKEFHKAAAKLATKHGFHELAKFHTDAQDEHRKALRSHQQWAKKHSANEVKMLPIRIKAHGATYMLEKTAGGCGRTCRCGHKCTKSGPHAGPCHIIQHCNKSGTGHGKCIAYRKKHQKSGPLASRLKKSKTVTAMEFPTEEALQKYLKEHPGADKSKHKVVKHESKPKNSKPSGDFSSHTNAWFDDAIDHDGAHPAVPKLKELAKGKATKANLQAAMKELKTIDAPWAKKALQHGQNILGGKFRGEFKYTETRPGRNTSSSIGEFFSMVNQALNYKK